jgi:hypothetical protein
LSTPLSGTAADARINGGVSHRFLARTMAVSSYPSTALSW